MSGKKNCDTSTQCYNAAVRKNLVMKFAYIYIMALESVMARKEVRMLGIGIELSKSFVVHKVNNIVIISK